MDIKGGRIILIFLFKGFLPLALFSQKLKGFEITGHLEGLREGTVVVLYNRYPDWHIPVQMDSCIAAHGNFHLKTAIAVEKGPLQYEVWLDPTPKNRPQFFTFLADNGDKITVTCRDINKIHHINYFSDLSIQGSSSSTALQCLLPLYSLFMNCTNTIDRRLQKMKDSIGFDGQLVQTEIEAQEMIDHGLDVALSELDVIGPAVPIFMTMINQGDIHGSYHAAFVFDLYKRLSDYQRNSYYGMKLETYARLSVGQPFPEFALPTPEGKLISLKDFVVKNKISIIHFWASNSIDRPKYQRQLKVFYKKYHEKGLGIIGVSADSVGKNWKEVIEE